MCFFSANDDAMDALEKAKLLVEGTRRPLLSNQLVIVISHGDVGDPPASSLDLTRREVKKIGLVKPESVPVGVYARRYLKQAKLWDRVQEKIVPFETTKALIAAVDNREVDAAIIFKTDALLSKSASIAARVPPEQAPGISFAAALLATSRQPDPANRAVLYFASPDAAVVFEKFGFTPAHRAQ